MLAIRLEKLLKEQEEQIKNRDESLEKAREEIKWLRGMLKEQEARIEQLNRFVNGFSTVSVVRCKYCTHGESGVCGDGVICDGVWHDNDWFCADGERKEGW